MNMKKLLLALAAVAVMSSACQKAEVEAPVNEGRVLDATIENIAVTRTVMDEDNNIRWSEEDQIVGFMKSTFGAKFQVTGSSVGETSASFEEVSSDGLNAGTELDHIIAYYPYSSSVKIAKSGSNYALDVVLPAEQTYVQESFGNGAMPMVAVSETNNITFRNVCGGMKLQLKGTQKVASVKVEGKNGEILSGAAVVIAYTDGTKPSITMSDETSTSVTLNCGSGVQLNENDAVEFIIVLPPVAFSKGFVVTVADAAGNVQTIETDKVNEVKRSALLVMPAVTLEDSGRVPQEGDYIDEYGINHGQGIEIDGVVWAPVNCGYHAKDFKYGKLYQWGRKYGQGYDGLFYVNGVQNGSYSDVVVPEYQFVPEYYEDFLNYYTIPYYLPLSDWQSHGNENTVFVIYAPDKSGYNYPDLWNLGHESLPIKTEYDPCPDGWRVPTYTELDGLRQYHSQWMLEEDQRGLLISDSLESEATVPCLFLPASGENCEYEESTGRGNRGSYWSSNVVPSKYGISYYLGISERNVAMYGNGINAGNSVRCVKCDEKDLIPVEDLIINKSSTALVLRDSEVLHATIAPSDATHDKVYWWSDNVSVATVDENGNVEAVSLGTANITAMAGMKSASCLVTVAMSLPSEPSPMEGDYIDEYGINHGQGIEIDGVIWAPVNCGYHAEDFKYGKLYQWGRKYGQGYNGSIYDPLSGGHSTYSDDGMPVEIIIEDGAVPVIDGNSLANENRLYKGTRENNWDWCSAPDARLWNFGTDVAPQKTEYDPCPKGWRVPTSIELNSLVQNYSLPSPIEFGFYAQWGIWLSGTVPYSSDAVQIFLPYAGYIVCRDELSCNRNYEGGYWSSSAEGDASLSVGFGESDNPRVRPAIRSGTYSVRCVQE